MGASSSMYFLFFFTVFKFQKSGPKMRNLRVLWISRDIPTSQRRTPKSGSTKTIRIGSSDSFGSPRNRLMSKGRFIRSENWPVIGRSPGNPQFYFTDQPRITKSCAMAPGRFRAAVKSPMCLRTTDRGEVKIKH